MTELRRICKDAPQIQKGTDVYFAGSEEKGFYTFSMGLATLMFLYSLMGMFLGLHASFDKCTTLADGFANARHTEQNKEWSGTRGLTEGGECTGGGGSTAERRQPEVSDGGHGGEDDGVAPGVGCSMATESPTEAGKWENGSAVGGKLQVDREFNEAFGKKGLHFVHLKVRSLLPKINEIRLLVCKSESQWQDRNCTRIYYGLGQMERLSPAATKTMIRVQRMSIVAASGQQLQQDQILKTRKEKQSVSFSCKVTGSCFGNTVHWYQKGEGKPFSQILYKVLNTNSFTRDNTHPQTADFSAMGKSDSSELKIQSVKVSHSATYYCACWDSSTHKVGQRLEFGSGTTLYVTDGIQRKPKVTLYSASNSESNEKTTLLCLARDMSPDLVKISWKIEEANGGRTEVPKAEGEQLEQREEEQTTSMIIIDKENTYRNKYICSVEHEWGAQHFDIPKDTPTTMSAPAFRNDMQESLTLQCTEDSFQSTCSLNLASLVYTVMIVKSMVYCCGLSLLLHNRILGRGPST
ncbi:uncharacterized protein LOC121847859 [Oncorhynchus tshawytscha]|uniref:uncharacterized protein LOC121847859 n=1 Tax=Oncorhynchus tshawytscha TaxID=74940 RepID=UPI001C3C6878|nr:uncharacterized protein LOC121847859 [Oncorhynchus tshawytscha]